MGFPDRFPIQETAPSSTRGAVRRISSSSPLRTLAGEHAPQQPQRPRRELEQEQVRVAAEARPQALPAADLMRVSGTDTTDTNGYGFDAGLKHRHARRVACFHSWVNGGVRMPSFCNRCRRGSFEFLAVSRPASRLLSGLRVIPADMSRHQLSDSDVLQPEILVPDRV